MIVSQYFWPEPFRVNDLARGLCRRGHDVVVLTGFPNYPDGRTYDGYPVRFLRRETWHGVSIVRVPLYPDASYSRLRRGWNYLSFMLSASLIGPTAVGPVEAIVVFQVSPVTAAVPAIVLKYAKHARLLLWVQDVWPDTLEAAGVRLGPIGLAAVRRLVRAIYARCDAILVQSRAFLPRVQAMGGRPDRVVYMPNWAEDVYRPVPRDEALAEKENMHDGFQVVFAGNIGRAQDFETLLGAAKILRSEPAIRFVIFGDGAMASHYREQAASANLDNVVFKGRRPVEMMPHYFALADSLLVLLRREPIFALTVPSKVQGYLACGRPVVAGVTGEAAQIVRESGAGVVCEPGNAVGLATAILQLSRLSVEAREAMGRAGAAYYAAHFERSMLLDRFETLLAGGLSSA